MEDNFGEVFAVRTCSFLFSFLSVIVQHLRRSFAQECGLVADFVLLLKLQRIFATLLRYERLPLLRLKSYSHLSFDQLRKGLAAMIQHHLVFHFTSYDDGITYYEADLHTAYYLARSGKIIELIEETLGNYAATVMSTIMFLGHAQVSHLETLPELEPKQVKTNGTSEEHDEQQTGLDDEHSHGGRAHLHTTLKTLAAHGYIIRVREAHFQSPNDVFLDAERAVKSRSDIKEMKGKRHEEAVKEAVTELIKERMGGDLTHGLIYKGVPFGVKRRHAVTSSDASNKRRKVDYTVVDGDDMDDESEWSDDDTPDETIPMEVSHTVQMQEEWMLIDCQVWIGCSNKLCEAGRRTSKSPFCRTCRTRDVRCHSPRV